MENKNSGSAVLKWDDPDQPCILTYRAGVMLSAAESTLKFHFKKIVFASFLLKFLLKPLLANAFGCLWLQAFI